MSNSKSLQKHHDALHSWMTSFVELLELCEQDDRWYLGLPTLRPKPGMQDDVARRAGKLDHQAVPAANALDVAGINAEWKVPGSFQYVAINPIMSWRSVFSGTPMTSPDVIVSCGNSALGALAHATKEAQERENSALGRMETAAAGPRRLLAALRGAPSESHRHPSAFWSGVVVALFVTIVGGLAVAYFAHRFGWV